MEPAIRLYKPNLISIFDPGLEMVRFIPSKCWEDDDNIAKMFVLFIFSQF